MVKTNKVFTILNTNDNYEIFGEIIDIHSLINEIQLNFRKIYDIEFNFDVDNSINYIRIKKIYFYAILNEIINATRKTLLESKATLHIHKEINSSLNIIISSKTKNFDISNLNDLLINFITELHNGKASMNYKNEILRILLIFPSYRIVNNNYI